MALPGRIHALTLVGSIVLFVGLILHIVGLATHYWSVKHIYGIEVSAGLFEACTREQCSAYDYFDVRSNVRACQSLSIMGMCAAIVGFYAAIYNILMPRFGRTRNLKIPKAAAVESVLSCACIVVCLIVWRASVFHSGQEKLGNSFILSGVGAVTISIGGVLVYVGARIALGP